MIHKYLNKLLETVLTGLLVIFLLFRSAAASPLLIPDSCGTDACPIPTVNELNQPVYAIVSPVGYHAVDMIAQAPRLDTLAGKKNRSGRRKFHGLRYA